jgi:phosphomannomutase/phosphoglucomutase
LADYERWVVRAAAELVSAEVPPRTVGTGHRSHDGPPHVVVDAMEGAFTHIAPRVLKAAGYATRSLSPAIDPDFSRRSPNPSSDSNLEQLAAEVLKRRADMGIALDGDGDRVVLVDHEGVIVRPEQLAVLIQQQCFCRPTVVYDLKSASLVARAVETSGGTACMRPSGYGFIKATMIDTRAEMGVEASGHHFFGVLDGGDDGLFTALVALEIVQRTNTALADLIRPIGWPAITPDLRIPFSGDAAAAMETIADRCGGLVSRLDGVRAQYDDGWALARPSITEPAITLRFEGRTHADLRQIASRFLAATPDLLRHVLEKI